MEHDDPAAHRRLTAARRPPLDHGHRTSASETQTTSSLEHPLAPSSTSKLFSHQTMNPEPQNPPPQTGIPHSSPRRSEVKAGALRAPHSPLGSPPLRGAVAQAKLPASPRPPAISSIRCSRMEQPLGYE